MMDRPLHRADAATKQQLCTTITDAINGDPQVLFAFLHGSFLETDLPFHDIDLGVFLYEPDKLQRVDYAARLSQLLSAKTALPVDVKVLNDAPLTFCYHVIRGTLLDNKDDELCCRFMEDTMRAYFDIKPILDRAAREAFAP
ncbi:MAG: nucleotidyltransferase domain-containing protein [Desulfobulbaceae bacterium]|nr:nucleotidyltransferase domain-containing protein [Desulfobulbaceae bacterium]